MIFLMERHSETKCSRIPKVWIPKIKVTYLLFISINNPSRPATTPLSPSTNHTQPCLVLECWPGILHFLLCQWFPSICIWECHSRDSDKTWSFPFCFQLLAPYQSSVYKFWQWWQFFPRTQGPFRRGLGPSAALPLQAHAWPHWRGHSLQASSLQPKGKGLGVPVSHCSVTSTFSTCFSSHPASV